MIRRKAPPKHRARQSTSLTQCPPSSGDPRYCAEASLEGEGGTSRRRRVASSVVRVSWSANGCLNTYPAMVLP